jgi:hypothetical protein
MKKRRFGRCVPFFLGFSGIISTGCDIFCVDCHEGSSGNSNKPIVIDYTVAFDYRVTNTLDGSVMAEGCGSDSDYPDTYGDIYVQGELGTEYVLELANVRFLDAPTDERGFDACSKTDFSLYSIHDDPACFKLGRYGTAFELIEASVVDAAGNRVLNTTKSYTIPAEPGDIERFRIRSYDYGFVEVSRNQPPCSPYAPERLLMHFAAIQPF